MHPAPDTLPALATRHRSLIVKLLALTGASFVFGFALVPFYDSLCRAIGFNGKSLRDTVETRNGTPTTIKADPTRLLTVQFMSTQMPGLPWEVRPLEPTLDLHPGELRTTRFLVHNTSNETISGQAVPSVSPVQAAAHFQKLECFCFRQQTLGPHETRELPLTFVVNPDLDRDIRELTLAYAFFPAPTNPAAPGGPR